MVEKAKGAKQERKEKQERRKSPLDIQQKDVGTYMETNRRELGTHSRGERVLGELAEQGPGLWERLKPTEWALLIAQDGAEADRETQRHQEGE
ncbi:unnamed protein product [Caretta caretta]